MAIFSKPSTVRYGQDPRHWLDLYGLGGQGTRRGGRAPVLVYLYGGSWQSGSRALYRFLGNAYAQKGWCVAIPDYRLFPQTRFPGFVEDAALAIAWVREHIFDYGGDPDRIVVMGHSAGAHIGALLTLDPAWLEAAGAHPSALAGFLGLAGPYSFNPLEVDTVRAVFEDAPDIALARPIKRVRPDAPPVVLAHGTADKTVGLHNSQHLAAAIREAGGRARLVTYDGIGHIAIMASIAWPLRFVAPVFRDSLAAMEQFIDRGRVEAEAEHAPQPNFD